ncbi:MAG: EAL domain-containing protein, partial [Gallionellaceae bacterium]|nr:EAL domain-containing protein [Gallionellaceae bacterium]
IRYAIERKKSLDALLESEERYALAVRGANDGLWDWNLKTDEIYFSPRWKSILGYLEEEIGNKPEEWLGRIHEDDAHQVKTAIAAHIEGKSADLEVKHRMLHKDGSWCWVLSRGMAIRDSNNIAYRMAGSQADITDRELALEKLKHDALHDTLTGLPNRALFMDRLNHAIKYTKRSPNYLYAVLFIDLDRFKVINDSLGHMIGDKLLINIARKMESCLRPEDTLARLGGDEFTILLEDIKDTKDASIVAERIHKTLAQPFSLDGHEIVCNVSIGIALKDNDDNKRPEDMLIHADMAMYRAKMLGRGRYEVFNKTMRTFTFDILTLEQDLRRALQNNEMFLQYQPLISLQDGAIIGAEALIRWQHPRQGAIQPLDFISLAEETGLIVNIGEWVLQTACSQMKTWEQAGYANLAMAVNVSAIQFQHKDFISQIKAVLQNTKMAARKLVLEITESIAMKNISFSLELLSELRAMGLSIAIDDFGTGYSSLSYLKRFPINTLKIDRSFINDVTRNSDDAAITNAIIAMSHNLKLRVIAEGVETPDQLAFLKAQHCDEAQGYLFSRPISGEDFLALLHEKMGPSKKPV